MPAPINLHWKFFLDYFRRPNPALLQYLQQQAELDKISSPVKPGPKSNKDKQPSPFTDLDKKNDVFYKARATDYRPAYELLRLPNAQTFSLHTTYPGLLAGSGYRHQTSSENELKLGFSFDYTTGLPILPGSSVKGLLRSAFPGNPDKNPLYERTERYIRYLLKETVHLSPAAAEAMNIGRLERDIFGRENWDNREPNLTETPMHQRDVFYDGLIGFDARPRTAESHRVFGGSLLGKDFITPHRNRKNPSMSPFTNPTPIPFLKVMPQVPVTFQFNLPTREGELLNPAQRLTLFESIIQEFGVGAKTRVGYGQLM